MPRVHSPIVLSADIVAGLGLSLVSLVGVLSTTGFMQTVLGLPLLLFLPGYGLVSALYPQSAGVADWIPGVWTRIALGFGASFAMLAPLGLLVAAVGLEYTTLVVAGLAGTIATTGFLVAGRRRHHRPEHARFGVSFGRLLKTAYASVFEQESRLDAAVNGALALTVLLALATLTYAVVGPAAPATFSSLSLLRQNTSGDLVADEYPTTLTVDDDTEYTLEVENHEHENERYTLVAQLQRFDDSRTRITERSGLGRYTATVPDGESWRVPVSVRPEMAGETLRLTFYLYTGEAPEEPSAQSASEHVFLWVTVTGADGPGNVTAPSSPTPTATAVPSP